MDRTLSEDVSGGYSSEKSTDRTGEESRSDYAETRGDVASRLRCNTPSNTTSTSEKIIRDGAPRAGDVDVGVAETRTTHNRLWKRLWKI